MINIVLVEPRIPQNTGNIGRLCLAINARLHLIYPLGFMLDSKAIKRSGMDYFRYVDLIKWDNLSDFWEANPIDDNHFFLSTKAEKYYFDIHYNNECFLYFGREDLGLDIKILESNKDRLLKIPMFNNARSLNLSNCVSIVAYEVLRQNFSKLMIE
ncbi:RNA methyltransferase [Helicobacter sp. 16-1353]|uniref:tRNA (cytidine(34)-2'-O)-methyltransferase n=1 Tax=Helicobacter sp. 16-1353 TaxID=2004996 RepID=UPI000DCC64C6|nr:tRNA (cytidine(34)-2'-O)-methyltransferase [Helicobacter sp. 16-1353]RAX53172.1 RNA methyltransferase [Helicobacter sp. 16-1353]